jgi:tetratricopeptide (TPR) repeat protein
MRVWIRTFFAVSTLYAADPLQLTLAVKAQSDYDKVALAPLPQLADTGNCIQSQAAALPLSVPEELSLLYFRRGYCTLANATITGNREEYATAAADFERAIEAWPARMRKPSKKQTPEPVSSALRILPWVARLHTSMDAPAQQQAQQQIAAAVEAASCTSNVMPATQCEQIVNTGHEWLGWMALGRRDLAAAAQQFASTRDTGWPEWVDGQRQFEQGNYAEAVRQERRAISAWKAMWQDGGPTLVRRLGPAPNLPIALTDLGGAQLLAGDYRGAIATLDASLKARPGNPAALYRRALAHDAAGESDAALADYGMASRVAFADTKELASGEAHLYRGIMLFRRKDFARAEDEFSSALNFEIPETLRPDAQAWRHMAAVAGGSCLSEKDLLTRGLASVSPYFPKQEARQMASVCGVSSKAGVQ